MADDQIPSVRKRRLAISANVAVQIIIAALLLGMVNWLVARYYHRFDWTKSSYYELADKTKQTLGALPQPLAVIVFIPEASEVEYIQKVLLDVRNLLKEFEIYGGNKLHVEYVDPQRDLARAKALVEQYKLDSPDVVIFAAGDRHKYVRLDEMVELESTGYGPMGGGQQRVRAFKGEGEFLAAIQKVTEGTPPKVYFLTGHGERDVADFDKQQGYSTLAQYIKRDNIVVEKWNLLEQQSLPADAGAIIIAGPRTPFTKGELAELDKYLKNHGRLILLLDVHKDAGLKPLIEEWGVQADDDMAVASGGRLLGTELMIAEAIGVEYAAHPIVAKLNRVNTIFPYSRSIRELALTGELASPDAPRVTELVKTPPAFWGETNPDTNAMEFNDGADIRGPLSLAVAVETSRPEGVDLALGTTRLVVVGTSLFVDNSTLPGAPGNLDFFMNALNWLLQREQLIAIAPKQPQEFSLSMTPNQTRAVYFLTIGGMPLVVALIGITVWVRRRK